MNDKKNCLEGIRAIACIGVFLCHFRGAFFPNRVIPIIDFTPLRIMTAGNPMVRILFVLSGFVISYKYFFQKKYNDIIIDVVKRWFRLFPGILIANLFVCFMMKLGILYNAEAANLSGSQNFLGIFNQFTPSYLQAVKEGLFTIYLNGANAYISPLWSIVYEFLGSILILAAISVFRESPLRVLFYMIQLTFFSTYYNYFVIGMLICDIYFNSEISKMLESQQIVNNTLCLISAVTICMIQMDDTNKTVRVIYGSLLVIFFTTLLKSQFFEKILGNKIMQKIGTLSFAIYIVHWPIIESFSSWYYIQTTLYGMNEYAIVLSDLLLTTPLVFLIAKLLNRYVISLGMINRKFWENKIL